MKLFYVGERYYRESGTALGVLYKEGNWQRSDWGFVNLALRRGETVVIRPATGDELRAMDEKLAESQAKSSARDALEKHETAGD